MQKSTRNTYRYLFFCLAMITAVNAQDMSNSSCGRVNNNGKISVKGALVSVPGGRIENKEGLLICGGNTEIRQSEILGHVEYIEDSTKTQLVPQIRHSVVRFRGRSAKLLDTTYNGNNFVSVDTLISETGSNLLIHRRFPLLAWGRVHHDGTVNDRGPDGSVILQGTNSQAIDGLGTFKTLELDNTADAFVINKGGFGIQNNLYLHRGVFRNSDANNVNMLSNSLITRSDESSIDEHPGHIANYSLKYVGIKEIVTGKEVPVDSATLKSMTVHNNGGLTMSRDVTVNDSLVVGKDSVVTNIRTDLDANNRHVLNFTRQNNDPIYVSARSEVIGSLNRTNLRSTGAPMVFHNRFTALQFTSTNNLNGASRINIDSRPFTSPVQGNGFQKVKRKLIVNAYDTSNIEITKGLRYSFRYGWINDANNSAVNESNSLEVAKVVLQHWDDKKWTNIKSSVTPAQTNPESWAFSYADTVTQTGFFAIGAPIPVPPMLVSRVQMEGPYRDGSMATDLRNRNLVPIVPPDIFPYNLDPYRLQDSIVVVPNDVVDWIVVELRKDISAKADFIKTGLLLSSGNIINPDGKGFMTFPDTLPAREYYVVIHHRNHLSVMSANKWRLVDEDDLVQATLDLSQGLRVLGGFNALKPVCFADGKATVWAMVAGDVNADGVIDDRDRTDYDSIYTKRDTEAYVLQDTDLSGIVTTRDINKSWNNRTRRSNVPR